MVSIMAGFPAIFVIVQIRVKGSKMPLSNQVFIVEGFDGVDSYDLLTFGSVYEMAEFLKKDAEYDYYSGCGYNSQKYYRFSPGKGKDGLEELTVTASPEPRHVYSDYVSSNYEIHDSQYNLLTSFVVTIDLRA